MFKKMFSGDDTVQSAIFVLTNEESIIQKIVGTLQAAGYVVHSATSGEAAFALLDQPPLPDMFILDLMMPDMDTSSFLEALRQRFGRIDLPPVLLLASDKEGEATAHTLQVEDYLQKPFESEELLTHVRQMIESRPSA